ncbi:hypothetical protein KVT40_000222 [Elsinoe batatas]|uniref:Uncharacterized protein n=1 Tax=Elsinoe batatas TaxID=2601811 RepID=A0A8K0PK24_9PEZI|nr:hypothetical protein KVT40_000222 [Elsinoe batatas]
MGACLSCLGLSQRATDEEPSESERLLYDETSTVRPGYGATQAGPHVPAPDPEEIRRHREMLERICAETANNLIDVQHTNFLTLRGKPSAEFTTLLNTHFAAPEQYQLPQQPSVPTTPNPNNHTDDPPEPPSPFTQAQIQAAQQKNGTFSPRMFQEDTTDLTSSYHSAQQTPTKSAIVKPQDQQKPHHDEDEDAAEEAWLRSITNSGTDINWDEIKTPQTGLVVDLDDVPAAPESMRSVSNTR